MNDKIDRGTICEIWHALDAKVDEMDYDDNPNRFALALGHASALRALLQLVDGDMDGLQTWLYESLPKAQARHIFRNIETQY